MYAKITKQVSNAKNMHGRKETIAAKVVVVATAKELRPVVTARGYMGRSSQASVVYCSVWVHGHGMYTSGRGDAGGYGYHKASAAFQEALASAGIELYVSPYERNSRSTRQTYIAGVGDTAVDEALLAIARALGYKGRMIIV